MPCQGLSLGLTTQIPVPSIHSDISLCPHQTTSGSGVSCRNENYQNMSVHANNSQHSHPSVAAPVLNFESTNPQDSTINSSTELSLSERQDLQDKVTKLLALLDEYFRQMQTMVSSLDEISGRGNRGPCSSLVSNWLINARVRLWKPMIEDMYKEEIGDAEIDSSSSSEYFPKVQADIPSTGYQEHLQNASIERCQTNISNSTSVDFQDEASAEDNYTNRKMRTIREDSSFLQDSLARMDGFVAYQMSEFALGAVGCLCHCDYSTPMSDEI
ncbi:Homeobox domain containing protein [Musa troglodytarum]|uniref:Homeobox domain containing protein n=1 Tax=Musa troglodytarum TaxID=320322 RepID=A0A9E7F2K5_9LILI|nr:Homeobox domain containing protein [Musa troglodytarum]